MTRLREDGRYRIVDEPRRLPGAGAASNSMIMVLPITIWLALVYHWLFFLLPGVLGFLIGGQHRWRDPLLALLSIAIFIGLAIVNVTLLDRGLSEIAFDYLQDIRLALTTAPLFAIVIAQSRTLQLRAAMQP